jgi:hypothetical protein
MVRILVRVLIVNEILAKDRLKMNIVKHAV